MPKKTAYTFVVASALAIGAAWYAESGEQRGPTPRPAEKPPEYGCVLRDLNTDPAVVPEGERIRAFVLKYHCEEKTRPVDIEVWHELSSGAKEMVKIATNVRLEKGDHSLGLGGGGLASGGRYLTLLKASSPSGKTEIHRRVDAAVCTGWHIAYVEHFLHLGSCDATFDTEPHVFKTGERIRKFTLKTNCRKREGEHNPMDIEVWHRIRYDEKGELVTRVTDVSFPKGEHKLDLMDGGLGREGLYVLIINDITGGSAFKTICSGWTLSQR
jgi:hypothetical protein